MHSHRVYLLEPYQDALRSLKFYFSEINAAFSVFTGLDEIRSGNPPDLVIMQANREEQKFREEYFRYKEHQICGKTPLIIIVPLGAPKPPAGMLEKQDSVFSMPVNKLAFLQRVAECLGIPPRRVFRIIVTISVEGSSVRYSAISVDFSESGMSFECGTEFQKGDRVGVRFVNPKTRDTIALQAEVVRKSANDSGTMFFYGARFEGMVAADRAALGKFISGKT